jgi:hypothetical protein
MPGEAATRRTNIWYGNVVMQVSLLLAMVFLVFGQWFGAKSGDGDLAAYEPGEPMDAERLASIDLQRVHAALIPLWVVGRLQGEGEEPFHDLMREVSPDPNLTEILEIIGEETRSAMDLDRVLWAIRGWNAYLDEAEVGYRIEGGLHANDDGVDFYLKTYKVVSDGFGGIAGQLIRVRVVRRLDDLEIFETYLGRTPVDEDGVLVIADRIVGFSLDAVWPLMDPGLDPLQTPLRRRFAPAVREAAASFLTPEQRDILVLTAGDRFHIQDVVSRIHERHRCGSRLLVRELPFSGLAGSDLRSIRRAVDTTHADPCPEATMDESLLLSVRSEHLQSVAGLEDALEGLVTGFGRAIAVHEIRHAVDEASEPLVCRGCPEDLSDVGVKELSAYLSSFGADEAGVLASYQACALPLEDLPDRGPAIQFLSVTLGDLCGLGPTVDLAGKSRALEVAFFGRSATLDLPSPFGGPIPVTTRGNPTDGWSHSPIRSRP